MLKELQFVRGSVGKSKVDMSLSHFKIQNGCVKGFNGVLSICAPIPLDLDCQPDASQLIKAIGNCKAQVEITTTPAGKLRLKSGSFKAYINCYNEPIPDVEPEGELTPCNGEAMLHAMKTLVEFIGDDATRQWSNGIMFRDKIAMATNNVCLVQAWIGSVFPLPANVPAAAVRELIRINEIPKFIQQTENSMTFHYSGDRWLRTQLYNTEWPDVDAMFNIPDLNPQPIPQGFWEGVDAISPFQDKLNRIYFNNGVMCTSIEAEEGAHVQIDNVPNSLFNINMLKLIRECAKKIDFSKYPAPGYFVGDRIRGLIMGMRS
jgi:hypothetical protein